MIRVNSMQSEAQNKIDITANEDVSFFEEKIIEETDVDAMMMKVPRKSFLFS